MSSALVHVSIGDVYTVRHVPGLIYVWKCVRHVKKKIDVIRIKELYSFIFKVLGLKCIEVSDMDKFQFWIKVQGLKTYLTLSYIYNFY